MGVNRFRPGLETRAAPGTRDAGWGAIHISNHDCDAVLKEVSNVIMGVFTGQ